MKRRALSKTEREAIYNKTDGHCAYCGEAIELKAMQADHVAPMEYAELITIGGNDPNHIDNLLPACRPCNYIKSTMLLEIFRNRVNVWLNTLFRDNVTYRNALRFGVLIEKPHKVQFYFEKIGLNVPDYLNDLNKRYKDYYERDGKHDHD
jgi:hypothetical protein